MWSRRAILLSALSFFAAVKGQDTSADSPYWHDRYHAFLSMAAYNGAYLASCPNFFTDAGLQTNFPGSTEAPFTVILQFGPTPTHGLKRKRCHRKFIWESREVSGNVTNVT
ncbi:hypothetical protein BT69DRAFT_1350736 [Atractiella rhizophila]|nr:hypothetical protein BT69DRAFT_1350736 [Atractiella rhizophila]